MASARHEATPPRASRPGRDVVERLYVYWLVSTLLLGLIILTVAIVTRGMLREQASVLRSQAGAIESLRGRLADAEERVRALRAELAAMAQSPYAAPPPGPGTDLPQRPVSADLDSDASGTQPAPEVPAEAVVRRQADALLGSDVLHPADVARSPGAHKLIDLALAQLPHARWTPGTWERLALLAVINERDQDAYALAQRALDGGSPLTLYAEAAARVLLSRSRPRDAMPFIEHLMRHTGGTGAAPVLYASALLGDGDVAAAFDAAMGIGDVGSLSTEDRLAFGRVLYALELWDRLDWVLGTIEAPPKTLVREYSFLLAVAGAQMGRAAEALALLDGLTEGMEDLQAADDGQDPSQAASGGVQPSAYEIVLWRGVALLQANQPGAARDALAAAIRVEPGAAGGYYWLGLLEAQAGRVDAARRAFGEALARQTDMASAWEGLASLEMNEGNMQTALRHLAQAIRILPRRGNAHFLVAIAHAKTGEVAAARTALRTAVQLDGRYVEAAAQVDVLSNVASREEIRAWAKRPPDGEADAAPQAP